ncbi:MAG: sigma-70 family RNA polymerase sigma factor [Actinobacteria bacterium]|nr:sigma-70 family RNA polymerase sigma factor [Actinomycetota bacterium]MBI3686466.1 sigma-70 family RNA polymerase sigma factor [Actinomycetota bacterium]
MIGLDDARPSVQIVSTAAGSGGPDDASIGHGRLFLRHRKTMSARAARRLANPRDIEDVVQEAFLRLCQVRPDLQDEGQALAYCRRIVDNLCIDRHRASARTPALVNIDEYAHVLPAGDDVSGRLLAAEDAEIVRDGLAALSPLHRRALVAREVEEKPLPQIAAELGIARNNVKHVLLRARRALRRVLEGTSVDPGESPGTADAIPIHGRPRWAGPPQEVLVTDHATAAGGERFPASTGTFSDARTGWSRGARRPELVAGRKESGS